MNICYYFCTHTLYFLSCSFSLTNIYLCISPTTTALYNRRYVMPPAISVCRQANLVPSSPYQTIFSTFSLLSTVKREAAFSLITTCYHIPDDSKRNTLHFSMVLCVRVETVFCMVHYSMPGSVKDNNFVRLFRRKKASGKT